MSAHVDEVAVRRGIAWLDDQDPTWRERVDPDRLDMAMGAYWRDLADNCGCVGAQLDPHGSYDHFLRTSLPEEVGPVSWAVEHGFELPFQRDLAVARVAYDALTAAWLRLAFGREVAADA